MTMPGPNGGEITSWHSGVKTGLAWPTLIGCLVLAIAFGGFGAWAAMAPLQGAVIASGTVVAMGKNKIVQHLEGGIVEKILVRDGDKVAAGDTLVILNGTSSQAALNRLSSQIMALQAMEARFVAEQAGSGTIAWPEPLFASREGFQWTGVVKDQEAEFASRLEKQKAGLAMLEDQIGGYEEEIAGHKLQKTEILHQIALLNEEIAPLERLLAQGFTTRSRVAALKRESADLKGQEGQITAAIAKAKQAIAEIREKSLALKVARREEASARLSEIRQQRSDLLEQARTARDILDRIIVKAPVSGTVINLTQYSSGAVIASGQDILEIVPDAAGLMVEARLRPQDIDEIHVGQSARLNFLAFDPKTEPRVFGQVTHVSADRFEDDRSGEFYYLARLRISSDPVSGFDPMRLGPGQPVDAYIATGERTLLEYLTSPILRTLRHSMRES
jgi:HlyD family secretion protein